jgi:hypothetical protein
VLRSLSLIAHFRTKKLQSGISRNRSKKTPPANMSRAAAFQPRVGLQIPGEQQPAQVVPSFYVAYWDSWPR